MDGFKGEKGTLPFIKHKNNSTLRRCHNGCRRLFRFCWSAKRHPADNRWLQSGCLKSCRWRAPVAV